MTARRGPLLLVLLLLVAVVGAVVAIRRRPEPTTPSEQVPPTWQVVRASAGHVKHVDEKRIACTECHRNGPAEKASLESCGKADCHSRAADQAHRGTVSTPTPCLSCHSFGRDTSTCVACHHRPDAGPLVTANAKSHHATEGAGCTTCHDVHADAGARSVAGDCSTCHGITATHGRRAVVPADAGALRATHANVTNVADGGVGAFCSNCHAPHASKQEAAAQCTTCHASRDAGAATPQVGTARTGHAQCTTCHAPHDLRKEATKACASCHSDRLATNATKGHGECRGCHSPHAPPAMPRGSGAVQTCKSCHADKHALAAAKVEAHANCTSCHSPHRPAVPASASCAGCHERVVAKHPAATQPGTAARPGSPAPPPGVCVTCHAPHPTGGGLGAPATACTSCHRDATGERGHHAGRATCLECHTPHLFPAKGQGPALCVRCHAPQARSVAAIAAKAGASSPNHGDCAACHGTAHAPTRQADCAKCHGKEAATAPRGHQQCGTCHEPHSGAPKSSAGCTGCHTNRLTGMHSQVPGGCATCHRPHGPHGPERPPACPTCHEVARLPGLHAAPSHAKSCASCHGEHDGHAGPRADRATCTGSCHVDRRAHQLDATSCKGCHLFRGARAAPR